MRLFQIDAFTDAAFKGNPAAVCLLDGRRRRCLDAERRGGDEPVRNGVPAAARTSDWSLRWFTPTIEVALCGHATLAAAHALLEEGLLPPGDTARFHTMSGRADGEASTAISSNWTSQRRVAEPSEPPERLIEALGANPVHVAQRVRLPRRDGQRRRRPRR